MKTYSKESHPDMFLEHFIFNIEERLRSLSKRKNVHVIAFLDCCRQYLPYKEGEQEEMSKGSTGRSGTIAIAFACTLDKKSAVDQDKGSSAWTNGLVSHME